MRRNASSSLEDAAAQLRAGMGAARRGRDSLAELRGRERDILRTWFSYQGKIFVEDPTLKLERRQAHGEHCVGYDARSGCWWKTTHPGTCGVGAEFVYEDLPPFRIEAVAGRELLPSEYIERLIVANREFADDIRLEGFVDTPNPSLVISQPDIAGTPATADQMETEMLLLGYETLPGLNVGKAGSISFYHRHKRIAVFDAHPGNFFNHGGMTIPIDGIIMQVGSDLEHQWLVDRLEIPGHE